MKFKNKLFFYRGKATFGYSDRELATKSGYDLIHPDDLNYFSSAHQECEYIEKVS